MRSLTAAAPVMSLALLYSGCVLQVGDGEPADPFASGASELNDQGCVPSGVVDRHALCVCGDFDQVGQVSLYRGESGREASLGVNGRSNLVSSATIEGSWHAYGGFDAVTDTTIDGDLVTARDVTWVGDLHVTGDLVAGGMVDGVGGLIVGGALKSAGGAVVIGDESIGSVGSYPGDAGPPCNCDGPQLFDVGRAVADARADNDNEAAGLPVGGIAQVGSLALELASGRYYLGDIQSVGDLTFDITGNVALFIDGSIDAVGESAFRIAEGGSLDLYIAGSVQTVGNVTFGSAVDPSAFRLLVGGTGAALVNVGSQSFFGQIYAPRADIDYVGDTQVVGALVARSLIGVGQLDVVYGGPVQTPVETCLEPEEEADEGTIEGEPGQGGAGGTAGGGGAAEDDCVE